MREDYRSYLKYFKLLVQNGENSLPPKKDEVLYTKRIRENISPIFGNLVFTTDQGLFTINNSNLVQLLKGKFYGITKFKEWIILSRSNNFTSTSNKNDKSRRQSEIIAIKIKEDTIEDFRILYWGIPGEVHQIDIINNTLHLPHTGFNQILVLGLDGLDRNASLWSKTFLSSKLYILDIISPSHLNSIYYSNANNFIYLVAHNSTAHTDRYSDIIKCNKDYQIVEIINTEAHSAHNICELEEDLIYNDSNHNKLMLNDKSVFKTDKLLRGLAIQDNIYVGGSDIDFSGDKRFSSDCYIYCLDRQFTLKDVLRLENLGNLKEIRILSGIDYSLSGK